MAIISVIIPVYNTEKYLNICLESILNQTFSDFCLILVNDGSTDNSPSICDNYASIDNRIHVIHQKNAGPAATRNAGIDYAINNTDCTWLTFIDSDDWVHEKYLEFLLQTACSNDIDISCCDYRSMTANHIEEIEDKYTVQIYSPENFYVEQHKFTSLIWGKLYKKDIFNIYRFPIGKLHEDVFLVYKLLFASDSIGYINTKLYYYFVNTSGITKSTWSPKRLDEIRGHKEQLSFFKHSPYKKALNVEIVAYIWVICEHIKSLQKLNKHQIIKLSLLLKLKFLILRYKKHFSIRKDTWAFELAYPLITRVYWKLTKMSRNK